MNTLCLFHSGTLPIHPAATWYLSDLGEFRGKQELYTRQSPQRLKALREHALIESAISSNRIEGVSVEPSRIKDVLVAPRPLFRDRDEEEIRGYRDALTWIHQDAAAIPLSEDTIKHLHAMTRGQIWDAGRYKEKDGDIIERYPDGNREFAERVGEVKAPRGAKRDRVLAGIDRLAARASGGFTLSELEQTCPGVSRDMVRRVLREQQAVGAVECRGRGPAATWRKKG